MSIREDNERLKNPTIDEARERLARRLASRKNQQISPSSVKIADELDYAADAKEVSDKPQENVGEIGDHWLDRVAASPDETFENAGFKPRKTSRRGTPRTKSKLTN